MREEILEYLYEKRYTINPDVIGFLKRGFPNIRQDQARDNLMQMVDDKIISGTDRNAIMAFFQTAGDKYKCMEDFPDQTINFHILPPGIKEHKENIFQEQVKQTNKAVIDQTVSSIATNKSIRNLNDKTDGYYNQLKWATWVIAIATGLNVGLGLLIYTKNDDAVLLRTQQSLQKSNQLIEEIKIFQKGIDESLKLMAKDSVKKIHVLNK